MKLISINIESKRHLKRVLPFLEEEDADVIGIMEAPEDMVDVLTARGYHTTFAPMTIRTQDGATFTDGVLFASKEPHEATVHYYHKAMAEIVPYQTTDKRGTIAHPVIFANVSGMYIAVTHFTWNPNGETADANQTTDLAALLTFLQTKPPHILCGDLNIPRNINTLYQTLAAHYTDHIPLEYVSSLDKNLHRVGNDENLQKLFTSFMVDYILNNSNYTVTNTRLEFGISDHAAVITTVTP
jgi:exonuclease III